MLIPVWTDFRRADFACLQRCRWRGRRDRRIGAFWYTGASDVAIYASAAERNWMRSAWELQNAPFVAELRHPRAPPD